MTKVPVLTFDRIMGSTLQGKKSLVIVDVEGAEYMFLQGAMQILQNKPRPTWIMEISTTEHRPVGNSMNPYFVKTFELFFDNGYRAFTADDIEQEMKLDDIISIASAKKKFHLHNFLDNDKNNDEWSQKFHFQLERFDSLPDTYFPLT